MHTHTDIHCNSLQYTVTQCTILQHTTICCNMLQHTATCCMILSYQVERDEARLRTRRIMKLDGEDPVTGVCDRVRQCVAVCCSVLQCVAVCCSVLQCVSVCHRVLQCVAMCCSMLQFYQTTSANTFFCVRKISQSCFSLLRNVVYE